MSDAIDDANPASVGHGFGGPFTHSAPSSETPRIALPATGGIQKRKTPQSLSNIRGSGFDQAKTNHLLSLLDTYLPLCKDEWCKVLKEHNKVFAQYSRTIEGLRRKFATLHRKKMPTGNPLIPPEVKRAKHIRHKMTDRADME